MEIFPGMTVRMTSAGTECAAAPETSTVPKPTPWGTTCIQVLFPWSFRVSEQFIYRILHYTSSLRGTKQCLQRQLSRLLSMVDTLGFSTVFFAHSAADLQWPELAYLPGNPDSRNERAKAVIEKPAIAYWFFYHRVMEFVEVLYTGVHGATDHWKRFEWQHRGSSYVHGLAWLLDTPDVE